MTTLGTRSGTGPMLTFRDPAAPARELQRENVERLLFAAAEADAAEQALFDIKTRHARAPSPETQATLMKQVDDTLEKEVSFDHIWEEVSKAWFGHVTRG